MANASVEKLKALGLRHGEKAVVGLTVAVCVACLALATMKETTDLTPEQIEQDAKTAESNLNTKYPVEEVIKRVEEAGVKNPSFVHMVEDQEKNGLIAANFAPLHPYVFPEPGAVLIREMPELIAPTELVAYTGRGGALIYDVDEEGNRILASEEDQAADTKNANSARRRALAKAEEEAQKKYEKELRRKMSLLAGKGQPKEDEKAAEAAEPEGPYKEITRGLRWISITGVLDYNKLKENYLTALKRTEVAYPHFRRLDLQRQIRQPDGTWSEWEAVDTEENLAILDNLPEVEEELTPAEVRIDALVDPLPFLKAGYWEQVHVASLVPKEKVEVEKPKVAALPGMMGGMGSSSGSYMQQMMQSQ